MKLLATIAAVSAVASISEAWVLTGPSYGATAKDKVWPKASSAWKTLTGEPSFSACHRGSRWHLPEESAGAYWEGALSNCEWNEPDITWSADGVAMVLHDSFLSGTTASTDPYFAGKNQTHCSLFEDQYTCSNSWWMGDFNVTDLKKVFYIQPSKEYPKGYRPNFYDHLFPLQTFEDFVGVNVNVSTTINTTLGLIPELKQPFFQNTQVLNKINATTEAAWRKAYFQMVDGIAPDYPHTAEDKFMDLLKKFGLPSQRNPIIIQCFEYETIRYLATKYPNGSGFNALLFLIDINWWALTPKGMDKVAELARTTNNTIHVGPWKDSLYDGIYLYALSTSAGYGIDFLDAKANPDLQYPGYSVYDIVAPGSTIPELHARGLGYLGYTYYDSRQSTLYNCLDPAGYPANYTFGNLWYTPLECPKSKRAEFFQQFSWGVDGFFVENANEFNQLRQEYNTWLLSITPADGDFWMNLADGFTAAGLPLYI